MYNVVWCGVFMCCYVPIVLYEYAIAAVAVASDECVLTSRWKKIIMYRIFGSWHIHNSRDSEGKREWERVRERKKSTILHALTAYTLHANTSTYICCKLWARDRERRTGPPHTQYIEIFIHIWMDVRKWPNCIVSKCTRLCSIS